MIAWKILLLPINRLNIKRHKTERGHLMQFYWWKRIIFDGGQIQDGGNGHPCWPKGLGRDVHSMTVNDNWSSDCEFPASWPWCFAIVVHTPPGRETRALVSPHSPRRSLVSLIAVRFHFSRPPPTGKPKLRWLLLRLRQLHFPSIALASALASLMWTSLNTTVPTYIDKR